MPGYEPIDGFAGMLRDRITLLWSSSCTTAGTIAVTILAGPLNYLGVNPKVDCALPQPSK
jgi:hypothetical protein